MVGLSAWSRSDTHVTWRHHRERRRPAREGSWEPCHLLIKKTLEGGTRLSPQILREFWSRDVGRGQQ